MTRYCPVCWGDLDLPSQLPLTHCSARCRDHVANAITRFLNALTDPEDQTNATQEQP